MSRVEVIRAHVFAAERIHADDATLAVLAKGPHGPGCGAMCAMIARSAVPILQPQCSSIRGIVLANIPSSTWRAMLD
jgi:hypothetical protein